CARRRCARSSSCRPPGVHGGSATECDPPRSPSAVPIPARGRASGRRARPASAGAPAVRVGPSRPAARRRRPRRGHPCREYAPAMAGDAVENYSEPILEGTAPSDYERYLNTEELLALQKGPGEWVHRDELLFQGTHQSSELWLKLCWNDAEAATAAVRDGDLAAAIRLLRRSVLCLQFVTAQLDMLEQMSPWEYQEIRKVLGHGSGFDSPGFAQLRKALPRLGE